MPGTRPPPHPTPPTQIRVIHQAGGPRLDLGPAFDDLAALESERQQQARLQHLADGGAPSPTGATVKPTPRPAGGVIGGVAAFVLRRGGGQRSSSAPRRMGSGGPRDKNLEVRLVVLGAGGIGGCGRRGGRCSARCPYLCLLAHPYEHHPCRTSPIFDT